MHESHSSPPYALLGFGMFFFAVAVFGTCTGKIWGRNGEIARRTKDSKTFWLGIVSYSVVGIGLVGLYFYKVYGL